MTLVDTSVLLDVFLAGAEHGDESETRLAAALRDGPVVINDIVAAELAPVFDDEATLWSVLAGADVSLAPYPRPAIYLAGQAFRRYRGRRGVRRRILADFMIGAHAAVTGGRLFTRGRGFYRDYFPRLRLV